MSRDNLVKIELRVDADGETHVETPWATPLGRNKFRLENMPFFAYDISLHDVVEAKKQKDGFPLVKRVVEKCGNRTVRVIFRGAVGKSKKTEAILDDLEELGCDFECANPKLVVVLVPPDSDFDTVTKYLDNKKLNWEYADPSSATLFD